METGRQHLGRDLAPEREHFDAAVRMLEAIPYFPRGAEARGAQLAIAAELEQFVESTSGLRYIVEQAISHMRKWEGVPELRGIYCAGGFIPRDGRYERPQVASLCSTEEPEYHKAYIGLLPESSSPEDLAEYERWKQQFMMEFPSAWSGGSSVGNRIFVKTQRQVKHPEVNIDSLVENEVQRLRSQGQEATVETIAKLKSALLVPSRQDTNSWAKI